MRKRQNPVYLADVIGEAVTKTSAVVLPELQAFDNKINTIRFEYGPFLEIVETLTQLSQQPSQELRRYPLIALILPIREDKGREIGIDGLDPLRILFVRRSNPEDKTATRYDLNFKPVLYPLYLEFMNQLDLDNRFQTKGQTGVPHIKTDWPFYDDGSNTNPFNDCIDAIEINLKIELILKNTFRNGR